MLTTGSPPAFDTSAAMIRSDLRVLLFPCTTSTYSLFLLLLLL